MASLIWEHIIAPRVFDDARFPTLRRNQKVEVTLTLDEIVDGLHKGFSFHVLSPEDTNRQPRVPRKE